uniref:Ribonuclease HII n=1 Tax=Megaviridae environmental sample TaxID=1737588 RepID=A0A5J6VJL6_9VIRU|nr:MAG: ribonuclease HII [Megaviridae environmental sample]
MLKFKNSYYEIGVDEAGRGPLIGPVYAAAVFWDKPSNESIIDSKKLTKKKRKLAYEWITENIKYYGIGSASVEEIDNLNILHATKLAMKRAINNLIDKLSEDNIKPKHVIIDGCYWEKYHEFMCDKTINLESVVKGDNKYLSIAAASILAKESHDNYIRDLVNLNPLLDANYKLLSNMGYGTKAHREGIIKHGLSAEHRKSFKIKIDS